MPEQIRVRLYNVRFGDAILITVPDRDEHDDPLDRHVLIDVGNALSTQGGDDEVFEPVLRHIADTVGERGIDLYVMTHEHLDHVQGLLHGATKIDPALTLPIATAWLTASAADDYYTRFPDARKHLNDALRTYEAIERHLAVGDESDPRLATLMANNNPRRTQDCIDYLKTQLTDDVHYMHRGFTTEGAHPFRTARFEIWAPEEDTSSYYGRFRPMALGAASGLADATRASVEPPGGVDAKSFFNLVDSRQRGAIANALTIDKAKNNSSLVFTITWNGWVLLFAGDAEIRSWRTMDKLAENGALAMVPVDFVKVSHHGSHNGTPDAEILNRILPMPAPDARTRVAAISTCAGTYNNVPDTTTTERLAHRCDQVVSTEGDAPFVDVLIG